MQLGQKRNMLKVGAKEGMVVKKIRAIKMKPRNFHWKIGKMP
jgi:hypothetical protein